MDGSHWKRWKILGLSYGIHNFFFNRQNSNSRTDFLFMSPSLMRLIRKREIKTMSLTDHHDRSRIITSYTRILLHQQHRTILIWEKIYLPSILPEDSTLLGATKLLINFISCIRRWTNANQPAWKASKQKFI